MYLHSLDLFLRQDRHSAALDRVYRTHTHTHSTHARHLVGFSPSCQVESEEDGDVRRSVTRTCSHRTTPALHVSCARKSALSIKVAPQQRRRVPHRHNKKNALFSSGSRVSACCSRTERPLLRRKNDRNENPSRFFTFRAKRGSSGRRRRRQARHAARLFGLSARTSTANLLDRVSRYEVRTASWTKRPPSHARSVALYCTQTCDRISPLSMD